MDKQINELFQYNGVLLKVINSTRDCKKCYFSNKEGYCVSDTEEIKDTGYCEFYRKRNKVSINFIKYG